MGRAESASFHQLVTKAREKTAMAGAPQKNPVSSDESLSAHGFGSGLAAFARAIIADARKALADRELSDAEAVHEVRKALKRWRALMRLLRRGKRIGTRNRAQMRL